MAIEFKKKLIDKVSYEAASVFDVNNDGKLDIACGEYWYEAPSWKKHRICDVQQEGEYYDDFSDIPLDVNGNGYMDIITGGWWGKTLPWRENPLGRPDIILKNGWLDIVAPGKEGLYLFENLGNK